MPCHAACRVVCCRHATPHAEPAAAIQRTRARTQRAAAASIPGHLFTLHLILPLLIVCYYFTLLFTKMISFYYIWFSLLVCYAIYISSLLLCHYLSVPYCHHDLPHAMTLLPRHYAVIIFTPAHRLIAYYYQLLLYHGDIVICEGRH